MTRESTPISPTARNIFQDNWKLSEEVSLSTNLDPLHAERLAISGALTHFLQTELIKRGGIINVVGTKILGLDMDALRGLAFQTVMDVATDCVKLIDESHLQAAADRLIQINRMHPNIFGSVFSEYEHPFLEVAADSQNVFDDAEVIWRMIPEIYKRLKGKEIDFHTRINVARHSSDVLSQRSNMHGIDFEIKKEQVTVVDSQGKRRFNNSFIEMVDENGIVFIRIRREQLQVTSKEIEAYMQDVTSERVIIRNQFSKKGCPARIKFNDRTPDYISYLYNEFLNLLEARGET